MRVLILFLAICLSVNMAMAKNPFKKSTPPVMTSSPYQVPIADEFMTDFVGYDEKEFKAYQKEQAKKAKLEKKRAKLNEKKVKLEFKKQNSQKNKEYCEQYIEKLRSTEVQKRDTNENL